MGSRLRRPRASLSYAIVGAAALVVSVATIGATAPATAATAPGAPRIVSAVAGATISVSFRAPSSNGGSRITAYVATCVSSNGGAARKSALATKSPAIVNNPTPARLYRCRVTARNASGVGPSSAFTPWLVAGVPVRVASPPRRVHVIGPSANLSSELRALRAGDVLLLRGGTYLDKVNISASPGSARDPIVVARYPGERPVIKGLFWVNTPSYYTFYGINVTWNPSNTSSQQMVKLTNGIGWTFRNAEVWGAHSFAGLLVAGTRNGQPAQWTISNSCIHNTFASNDKNQDHLIYANTGVSSGAGLITHNLLFDASNGEAVKIGGAEPGEGSAHITVARNTIYNTGQSVLVGYSSKDTTIVRNIMSRVASGNGNIRGYELTGTNNRAMQNVGYEARALIVNYDGGRGVTDAGGNRFPLNPMFNGTKSCGGFKSTNPAVAGYGR